MTKPTTYLLKRGYKRDFVTKQIQRAEDIPPICTLQPKQINKPERIPFINDLQSVTFFHLQHNKKTLQSTSFL